MRYALAFVLLIATPATAREPQPLLVFDWENQPQALPAVYAFTVANPGGGESAAAWFEQVTAYPHHSFASSELVERFNFATGWFPWHPVFDGLFPIVELDILDNFIDQGGHVVQGPERPALCTSCYWDRLVANNDSSSRTGPEWKAFAESVGWHVDLRVPLLGQGLRGYGITAVERLVTADSQTITLHGIPIPEPASWLLVLIVHVSLGRRFSALTRSR
jgi:hypothetical protein